MSDEVVSIVEFSDNIADVEAPEPLPAGSYPAQITGAEVKISQRGTKYCAVSFFINVDDFPADFPVENAPDGVVIIYRRVGMEDTPNSRYSLKQFCTEIGAPMASRIDVNDWIGLEATVEVEVEEWNGIDRANIAKVEAA
jgi:hypothetical protein